MPSQTPKESASPASSESSSTPASADEKPSVDAAPEAEQVEDNRPNVAIHLEALGVVKGSQWKSVHMSSGYYVNSVEIEKINAHDDRDGFPADVVITFKEDGLATRHLVRWSSIEALVR